ncbi:MAG: extracellular solute-binding protein, partial [Ktedonobacteraceae bacterium]|nr:extracellular solute-binding protein [Ktedonobacteraceae bacterium]
MKIGTTAKGRSLWVFLFVILLAGQILVACSQGGTNQAGGPVDLTVWINPAASEAGSLPANSELYKVIREKLNINLKLTLLPSGTDGTTKMNAAAAANNLPDLFQVLSNDLVLKWIDLGLVAPVNSLLPMMPGRTKDRYSNADLNKLYTINGQLYVLQEPAQLTRRQGVFIRKDWLDKLGLQPPKTLDELLAVARAFTTRDPDGNGKNDTYGFGTLIEEGIGLGSRFNFIYGAYGISDVWDHSTSDKITLSVRKPGYLAATQFIRKMVEEKVIDPDWTTLNKDEFRARWKQGKYGIMTEDFCAAICQANYKPFDENFPNAEFA